MCACILKFLILTATDTELNVDAEGSSFVIASFDAEGVVSSESF